MELWRHMASIPTFLLIPHVIRPILAIVLLRMAIAWIRFRPTSDERVISMGLDVLLQILGTLESLATEFASVRLEWHMYTDVRGDVVAFDDGNMAVGPATGQIEVVGTLATDVPLANVFL